MDQAKTPARRLRAILNFPLQSQFGAPLPAGDVRQQVQSDGQQRQFEVHVPKGYDGKSDLPVVYMMHGITENMDMMREYSQMDKMADPKGFAVVYMQAGKEDFPGTLGIYKENSWNLDHGTLTPRDPKYNDVDYMKDVKKTVEGELKIDKDKEYIAGFSEGGQAAQYMAQEMPHQFAGIASVHGTILDKDPKPPTDGSSPPMPMLSILGDDDNILPINGGHGWFSQGVPLKGWLTEIVPKVGQSEPRAQAPDWAAADGDNVKKVEDNADQQTTTYSGGKAPVEQIVRHSHLGWTGSYGGQHAWDGGNNGTAGEPHPDLIQYVSRVDRHSDPSFDASRTVMDFLLKNKRQ